MTIALEEHLPYAVLTLDAGGQILSLNHIAARLLGEVAQRHLHDVLDDADELYRFVRDAARHGTTLKAYDYPLHAQGKPQKRVNLTLFPVADNRLMLLLDVLSGAEGMEKIAAQQQVSQRAALMADMLAHEIKNPLSSIRGAAQLLHEEHGESEPLTALIVRESDRIVQTLERVAFLTQRPHEAPQPINIHELLHDVRRNAHPQLAQHVTMEERFDPSLPPIAGHRESLLQLFGNLFKNALEALEHTPDARLTITTSCPSDVRLRRGGQRIIPVCITIHDNGAGIDPALHSTLFDPYVTTKKGGNGLGLAIVAKIAHDHEGVAELVHSRTGDTLLRVLLPSVSG